MKKLALILMCCRTAVPSPAQELDAPRPIPAVETVWIEEMTWMEVRDAIKAGKTTAIVPTGGIEQNGPYTVTGKHNFIVRADAEKIARRLGNALLAPVIGLAPEDYVAGEGDYRRYPGTFHLRSEIFKEVLIDVCTALRQHGFKDIILIGDNLANQTPMKEVAEFLNSKWAGGPTTVHHIPEYYAQHQVIDKGLPGMGIHQKSEGIHDSYRVTATLMAIDPKFVRLQQRIAASKTSINGVSIVPAEKTIEMGNKMAEIKTAATVETINKAIARRPNR